MSWSYPTIRSSSFRGCEPKLIVRSSPARFADINTIMQLIPAGIVLVLFLRRVVLAAERKLVARRRASAAASGGADGIGKAGVVTAASMPFVAGWLAVIERPFMRPVGVRGLKDWTWFQLLLVNFIILSAVVLNTVSQNNAQTCLCGCKLRDLRTV